MADDPNVPKLLLVMSLQDKKLFELAAEKRGWTLSKCIRVFMRAAVLLDADKAPNITIAIAKAQLMEKNL